MSGPPKRWSAPIGADQLRKGEVDACVVGSGAGGAPVALALSRAGYRVLVLEKGPAYDQRDFLYDEIRSCRRDFFAPSPNDEPHVMLDAHGHAKKTQNGWIANCVGGGTVHFSGWTFRLHPEDLKLRSTLGKIDGAALADWPITWEELAPYYEKIEYELGVSGDAKRNPFENYKRPLPLPPLQENGFAALLDEACKRMGYHSYPMARAILSKPWNGRGSCRRSHFCGSYGCETGAKSSTLAALLPKAVATGRCQIRPMSMVTRIDTDEAGKATGVQYLDASGTTQKIKASVVVVACSAVESARLLLMSSGQKHPQGLGNSTDLVGRHLMFLGKAVGHAEFSAGDKRMQAIDWNEPFINRALQDFYMFDRGKPSQRKGGTIAWLRPHANPIYTAEILAKEGKNLVWGKALKDKLRNLRNVRRVGFEIFGETLPNSASRVTLDPEIKDRFGLPAARLTVPRHKLDTEATGLLTQRAEAILAELKASKTTVTTRAGQDYVLQCGTARFGNDPKTSVLNRDCRVHSSPNVFVTDSSFMPTSGGVPNTLTIEANALRVGERIVALGKAHELFKKHG